MKHPLENYPGDPLVYRSIQNDISVATGGYNRPKRPPRPLSVEDFRSLIESVKEGCRK